MDDQLAMNKSTKGLILLLTLSGSALADDAGLLRCRGIVSGSARLACYDALVVPAASANTATTKLVSPPDSRPLPPATGTGPAPAVAVAPATSNVASNVPANVAAAPSTPAAAPVPKTTDTFGFENRASPVTVDAIESYIPGRFEGWQPKSNIQLANGQVWQVMDDTSRYLLLTDAKVRIRRGALGAFYLEFEKSNHSPRVRRVK